MKTQVAIVGAGPAGLLLGHLLRAEGIDAVVIERQSAEHVLSRIRAGVLEDTATDLLRRLDLAERMDRECIRETGFYLADGERLIRIELEELTGRCVTVYGQTEVTRDLINAAEKRALPIFWNADDVALHDIESASPSITFHVSDVHHRVEARFIAGCDGYHGPSRRVIPETVGRVFERIYPFGWLGILADVPPCNTELIYANHARGFALASKRSHTRSRYYVQVPIDEKLEDWPDERLWDEVCVRLGPDVAASITRGPALEKSIAPLRSFVFEPMRHGSLFLAGDAAHIVPPTGAKGLNLAASDVEYLSRGLIGYFKRGDETELAAYSRKALTRVWNSERFSCYLTNLMHRFPEATQFERRMQLAELDHVARSRTARAAIAEVYVGLPL